MLPENEITELALAVKAGDRAARDRMVTANLRFVISVAKQYHSGKATLGDLINEGNLGLIIAADKYDPSRGFKFISYAVWWIRQKIMQYLGEVKYTIGQPEHVQQKKHKIVKALDRLYSEKGYEADVLDISGATGVSVKHVTEILAHRHVGSFDMPVNDSERGAETVGDFYAEEEYEADKALGKAERKALLLKAVKALKAPYGEVVTAYFGLETGYPESLKSIAARFNYTTESIRLKKDKAVKMLQRSLKGKGSLVL